MRDVVYTVAAHEESGTATFDALTAALASTDPETYLVERYSAGTVRRITDMLKKAETFAGKLTEMGYKWDPKTQRPLLVK